MMTLKRTTTILFAVFSIAQWNFATQKPNERKVECAVEIMPNYIWHLFALANLWDHETSPYTAKFGSSVPKDDIDFLHKNKMYMVWGNGRSSMFTGLLFFIPFAREISPEDYFLYLDDVEKAAKTSDWLNFMKKYCPQYIEQSKYYSANEEQIAVFIRIKNIIKNNYPTYQREIWKHIKPILDKEKARIDSAFYNTNIIDSWEKAMKMNYPGDSFIPVLTYANALDNLPSANNLSDSRNNFGANEASTSYNIDLIVHEIGIFTFFPTMNALSSDASLQSKYIQDNNLIYQSIESYIEKKKEEITGSKNAWEGKIHGGGRFDFSWFFKYYQENEGKYDTRQLIYNAICGYEKEHNK